MKIVGIVFVAIVLGTPAAIGGSAVPGQVSKHGGGVGAPGKAAEPGPRGGHASKNGGPSATSKAGKQGPGGGKGSSGINGTGIGARH